MLPGETSGFMGDTSVKIAQREGAQQLGTYKTARLSQTQQHLCLETRQ